MFVIQDSDTFTIDYLRQGLFEYVIYLDIKRTKYFALRHYVMPEWYKAVYSSVMNHKTQIFHSFIYH